MTTLAAWRPATTYAKSATVRPNAVQGSVPVPLDNGDFEDGDTGWAKDAGWAISTGSAYAGSYMAIYTGTGSGTIKTSGTYPATPGQVVQATVKAKVLDSDDGATALLLWYNSANVLIGTSTGLESSVETGVWMQLETQGIAPDGTAYVVFAVEATRTVGASVAIDDARWDYSAPMEARRMAYRAVQEAAGVSGVVEPNWPTTLGTRITDGTVIWEAVEVSWIEWTAQPLLESGLTEPNWPTTVGSFIRDGTINWECTSRRVDDENCPNTKAVAIISSKVFAVDKDIVRFCATANPLDWSSEQDAGYLPTGLQQANANDMAVLYPYRGNLACWNANCFQMWQVDPDPAQMALLDQMDGIGSTHPLAARAVGNNLYFLANQGVRSVGIANAAQNMQAGDVGMPIDVLVQAAMVQAAIESKKALSTYWPGMGQYWLCFGDDGETAGAGGALALACPTNISAIMGEFYSYTYVATGGTAPYTFSVVSGTLPPGLTLDEDTGVLSGTLTTAGSYSFGVQVADALGVVAFCGWAAEVLEDEAEIEAVMLLVTGQSKTEGGPMLAKAAATAAPDFVGIEQSTGADETGVAARYGAVWAYVGEAGARYSVDELATWQIGTDTWTSPYPERLVGGADGWLCSKIAPDGATWSAPLSPPNFTGEGSVGGVLELAYAGGYYWWSFWGAIRRAPTPSGPWTVVSTFGTLIDIVDHDGAIWATITRGFNGHIGDTSYHSVYRFSDADLTDPVMYLSRAHSETHRPTQLCSGLDEDGNPVLVAYCFGGGTWTSADGWTTWVDCGVAGTVGPSYLPDGGDNLQQAGGRRIASAGRYFYVISGNDGLGDKDQCAVSANGGLSYGAPVTLPITDLISIVAGRP